VLIMGMQRVPCDVGTEFLKIILNKFMFQSVKSSRGESSAWLLAPVKGLMC
jgi:hypothetical protein